MRILIVYNTAMEPHSISGVQRHFAGVVPHWIESGHTVDFLLARAAWPLWQTLFPDSKLISSDNWIPAPTNLANTWWCLPAYGWRSIPFHYARQVANYDLIYACAPFIYEILPALYLAHKCRAKLAVKAHHLVSFQPKRSGLRDALYLHSEKLCVRLLNRYADVILTGSTQVAAQYSELERRLNLSPRKAFPTGYGIDLNAVRPSWHVDKSFDAVVLGRVHAHKGVLDLPEAWEQVAKHRPGARLLVIGEGPHRSALMAEFEKRGLGPLVTCTGGISDIDKDQLIAQTRIGLSLSREEGWGLSITEFLAAGLPVVAMHLPIFDEVFPGQLDLTPLGDTQAFAERILWWLNHPDDAKQRGIDGRRFVERYDYKSVAEKEFELLSDAFKPKRS